MAATSKTLSGLGEVELAATTQQLVDLSASCLNFSLNQSDGKLSPQQKSDLKTTLSNLRTAMVEATDTLSKRRGRIKEGGDELQSEIVALDESNQEVSNLFRLMGNAIASCPDAAFAAGKIKATTDTVLAQAAELTYRLYITQVQQGTLAVRVREAQDALGILERVNLALG